MVVEEWEAALVAEAAEVVQEGGVLEEPAASTALLGAMATLEDANLGEPEPDVTQVL
jgi:hypothetical protein